MQMIPSLMGPLVKWQSREAEIYAQIGRAAFGASNLPGYLAGLHTFVVESGFEAAGEGVFSTFAHFGDLSAKLDAMQQEAVELRRLGDAGYAAHLQGSGWFWRRIDPLMLLIYADRPVALSPIADDLSMVFNHTFPNLRSIHRPTQEALVGYDRDQPFPVHTFFAYSSTPNDRRLSFSPQLGELASVGISREATEQFLEAYAQRIERGNRYFPK